MTTAGEALVAVNLAADAAGVRRHAFRATTGDTTADVRAPITNVAQVNQAFEVDAGQTIEIHWAWEVGGVGTPTTGDWVLKIAVLKDNDATVVVADTVVESFAGGAMGSGNSGHSRDAGEAPLLFTPAQAGTYRIRVKMEYAQVTNDAVAGRYVADSDGGYTRTGTPNTWAATLQAQDKGYVRAGIKITAAAFSNVSAGGAAPSVFAYDDTVFARLTTNVASIASATTERFADRLVRGGTNSANTNEAASTTWDATHTAAITNTFTVGALALDHTIDVDGVSGLTGFKWTHYAAAGHAAGYATTGAADGPAGIATGKVSLTKANAVSYDNRLTFTHLFQIEDNAYGVPPLSKHNTAGARLVSERAFLSERVTNARGEGKNGVQWSTSLQDQSAAPEAPITKAAAASSTQGGQAGWHPSFLTWSAQLPGGTWRKTNAITSPANATGLGVATTADYVLKAPDPKYGFAPADGPQVKTSHFVAGRSFQAGVSTINGETLRVVGIDATSAVALVRLQDTGANAGRAEYLDPDDLTWKFCDRNTALEVFTMTHPTHPLAETRADSGVYLVTFTGAETAGWGDYDVFVIAFVDIAGVRYTRTSKGETVAASNPHDGYKFDPTGLFK